GDVFGGRPTLLWALALQTLPAERCKELRALAGATTMSEAARLERACALYHEAGVFEQACRLVEKHRQRAEEIADNMEPESLRRLLYYLVDTVLEAPEEPEVQVLTPTLPLHAAGQV